MAADKTKADDRNRKINVKKIILLPSLWILLIANIITICFALSENWSLFTLIWIYWSQSVLIGIFSFLKIIIPAVKTRHSGRLSAGLFFLMHYGLFHIGYLVFLGIYTFILGKEVMFYSVFLGAGIFLVDHAFSYFHNKKSEKEESIVKLMLMPYLRILPIHIIIGMTSLGFSLMLFMVLKTLADLAGHVIEHRNSLK